MELNTLLDCIQRTNQSKLATKSEFLEYVRLHENEFSSEQHTDKTYRRNSYGKHERNLTNILMRLCDYRGGKNVRMVNQIMSSFGYRGYELHSVRFRQRIENFLKEKRKQCNNFHYSKEYPKLVHSLPDRKKSLKDNSIDSELLLSSTSHVEGLDSAGLQDNIASFLKLYSPSDIPNSNGLSPENNQKNNSNIDIKPPTLLSSKEQEAEPQNRLPRFDKALYEIVEDQYGKHWGLMRTNSDLKCYDV